MSKKENLKKSALLAALMTMSVNGSAEAMTINDIISFIKNLDDGNDNIFRTMVIQFC